MSDVTTSHDPEGERFELHLGDELASLLDYRVRDDDVVDLVHARTEPSHRGRGLAGQVTTVALEHARANDWQVRPLCSFVRQWMADRADTQDLVPPDERPMFFSP